MPNFDFNKDYVKKNYDPIARGQPRKTLQEMQKEVDGMANDELADKAGNILKNILPNFKFNKDRIKNPYDPKARGQITAMQKKPNTNEDAESQRKEQIAAFKKLH